MHDQAGKTHPSELTGTDVVRWINAQQDLANNTLRAYTATARVFLEWSARHGHSEPLDLADESAILRRSYPKTFGKVQDTHAAHRLTYHEAYIDLVAACQDGTWRGSRDQLAIRIGLLGIRVAEVVGMTWGNLQPDGRLTWIGKGRKPRVVQAGPTLLSMLTKWRKHYEANLGRRIAATDPILVAMTRHRDLDYGHPMGTYAYAALLQMRADRANLGHLSPHDLRRTAAKLLHEARTDDGAHRFDLADIQQILGHANPDTTAQYLDALDTAAITRAAQILD